MSQDILAQHPWLWPLIWQSTLCLAAGLGGSFLLRKRAARAYQVLLLGLIATVAIPALRHIVKQNQWGLLVAERAVATSEPRPVPAAIDWVIPDRPIATEATSVPLATGEPERVPVPALAKPRFEWTHAILPAWLSISTILLLRLAAQFLLGRRLAKRSEVVEDSLLLQMIEHAKGKLGVRVGVEVRRSGHARSPVIWCWGRRPTLVIPTGPCLGDDRLDWVSIICHELAHAKRHDHISGLFVELLLGILPWQPLLWWARHRLAALSEEACDDWVLASGQRASGYARTLLGLTAQSQATFIPGVVTSRRGLAGRIRRILADGCGSPRAGARWSLAAIVLTGSLAVGIGFAQARPAASSLPATEPSAASREQLHKILDAMLYHDRAVLPIALHADIDLYDLDAPADSQHNQTYVFEQRLDGKRLDSLMNVYRLRDGQFQHQQVNRRVFTGEQFVYRQQQVGDRSYPDSGVLYPKEEASRILGVGYMWGSTLFGHLPGDEEPVASLLKKAADVVLHEHREEVDGFACHVIEGKTDHGVYKLWIDPAHDFRIRRAIIDKGPDDLYHGKPVSTKPPLGLPDRVRTSVHAEISGVKLEKIGAHFIPTVESTTTAYKMVSGKEGHSKIVVKRSQIDLNPDFEKLGAFVMDGIPEGASLTSFDPNDHTYAYEWRNGKAVSVAPDGGTLVGRIQFPGHADLGTILTDKRSFHARFAPAGLGEKDSRSLTLRPERNGTFQVKDIPPGRYRLTLEMSEMKLVPASEAFATRDKGTGKSDRVILGPTVSGGLVWRGSILAEAEREFAIPEGKDAAQKTIDLGVIEMTLPSADAGKEGDPIRGQAQKTEPRESEVDQARRVQESPTTPERTRRVPAGTDGKTRVEARVYALEHISPARMQAIAEALIEKPGYVTFYGNERKAAVVTTSENHQRLDRIIRIIDVPEDDPNLAQNKLRVEEARIITLEHFSARQMEAILRAMLGETGYAVADEQRRCLNIGTTRADMRRVESIVRELDTPADNSGSETEAEELREQMRRLREQMQQIQNRLDQIAGPSRTGNANGSSAASEPYQP